MPTSPGCGATPSRRPSTGAGAGPCTQSRTAHRCRSVADGPLLSSLTLVLPVHNEAENLSWLLPHAAEVLPTLAEHFELIVVDDGSTDGGDQLASEIADRLGMELTLIRHGQKSGYGKTVGDGLRMARGDFVAFTDADGQFEIGDLALLVPLLDRADLAAGWRRERQDARAGGQVREVNNPRGQTLNRPPTRNRACPLPL